VCGLPLGSANPLGAAGMVNLIGQAPDETSILQIEATHLHLYGKSPRPGRKLGHVTVLARSQEEVVEKVEILRRLVNE